MFHVEHSSHHTVPIETPVITIMNQKGGVGKTTTVLNVATAFAAAGKKTLMIDLDPQGHIGIGLGIQKSCKNIYSVFSQEHNVEDTVYKTYIPHLDVILSSQELAGAEIELVPLENREKHLSSFLENIKKKYDFIFIDCSPSLGLLTINALVAASHVLIPLQCEFYALEGLSRLLSTIKNIQKSWNQNLKLLGILLTMYDKRCLLHKEIVEDVRNTLKNKVFDIKIPRNVSIAEASSHGKPAILYNRHASGAQAYLQIAKYLLTEYSW